MLLSLPILAPAVEGPAGISDADAIRIYRSWADSLSE